MQYREIVKGVEEKATEGNFFITATELETLVNSIPPPKHGDEWGRWKLNDSQSSWASLDFADGEFYSASAPYYIPVREIIEDEGLLDWVKHLMEKRWCIEHPENIGNFVGAAFDLRRASRVTKKP